MPMSPYTESGRIAPNQGQVMIILDCVWHLLWNSLMRFWLGRSPAGSGCCTSLDCNWGQHSVPLTAGSNVSETRRRCRL